MNQLMQSNDEDFNLFLEEFGQLLNKYHYTTGEKMRLAKLTSPDLKVCGFQADGTHIWALVYNKDENVIYNSDGGSQ